jgi:hypothetical protein
LSFTVLQRPFSRAKKVIKNVKSKVGITNENKEYYDLKATSFEEKIDYILNDQIYIKRIYLFVI